MINKLNLHYQNLLAELERALPYFPKQTMENIFNWLDTHKERPKNLPIGNILESSSPFFRVNKRKLIQKDDTYYLTERLTILIYEYYEQYYLREINNEKRPVENIALQDHIELFRRNALVYERLNMFEKTCKERRMTLAEGFTAILEGLKNYNIDYSIYLDEFKRS